MIKHSQKLLFAAVLTVIGLGFAQTGVGVSPPRVEIRAEPGDTISRIVTVDNPGNRGVLEVTAGFNDFLLDPGGNALYLPPATQPRSLLPWISVTPLTFDLGPRASQDVAYTIRVPNDAKPGSYWGIVFLDSAPKGARAATKGVGVRFRVRVGHVIYVHVGKLVRSGEILGFAYRRSVGKANPAVLVNFKNTGNTAIRLNGRVEVRNADGTLAATAKVEDVVSLPGLTHDVRATLDKNLPAGHYVLLAVLDYGQKDLLAGEGELEVQ